MQNSLSNTLFAVVYIFEAFSLQYFFSEFMESKVNNKRIGKTGIMIIWILLCLFDGKLFDFYDGIFISHPNLFLLVRALLLFLFSLFWYKGEVLLKIFLIIQFIAFRELSLLASYSLTCIQDYILKRMSNNLNFGLITSDEYQKSVSILMIAIVIAIGVCRCILLYFSIREIVRSSKYKENSKREILYYSLPAIAGILVSVLMRQLLLMTFWEAGIIVYDKYPLLYWIVPLISIILLLADVVCFKLYQDLIGLQLERAEKIIMQNQIVQMQNAMNEMDYMYDGVRKVRHDLKNQMTVLQSLLREKGFFEDVSNDELHNFFDDISVAVEQCGIKIHTGNSISDTIINSKFRVAENEIKKIKLDADEYSLDDSIGIKAYDIGIILNNGLDNAIEACKKLYENSTEADIYISIRSFKKGKMFFIEIENSYDGVIQFDRENNYPISTKGDNEFHGIGLKNIKNCAKKYGGDVDFIIADNAFTLSVMIKG